LDDFFIIHILHLKTTNKKSNHLYIKKIQIFGMITFDIFLLVGALTMTTFTTTNIQYNLTIIAWLVFCNGTGTCRVLVVAFVDLVLVVQFIFLYQYFSFLFHINNTFGEIVYDRCYVEGANIVEMPMYYTMQSSPILSKKSK
jgi:hypothetical protein